ncbi:MAG: leucine-rich repeat protein [Clostridia bacterium]|nr:leucine-rich repeat protein [Clostridia bacterium]
MGIRICPDCGGKVSESRRDCIHCGYVFPLTKQCPDCGESVEENAKVCPECGYPFEVEQTTGVATASVAPTVQTNKSKVEQTSKLHETTSVVCPQCGSNDIELKSSELGKCRACGTTVVLPKKEQQVNVVNNFVVNNNAENSAQYYTIKRERTLNDEFIRGAYVAMTQDRKTPIDISDGEFDHVNESNEQYIEVDSTANITYSVTVGYDYKVTYTEYDSQGKPVQRTKTETEWKPFSGSHVTQSTVYVGNDDNSNRASAFNRAVNHAEPGSIMPYDGTNSSVAPLTPNPASIEEAKQNAISQAESEAERSLPGDRHKDFRASGSATVNSVKSYSAPTQDAVFKYKEEEHFCTAFAFGPFMLGGTSPDDSDSIHRVVKEKTNPLFIASLSLLGVLIVLIVVAFACPVGFDGALTSILVPACVMLAMLIASIVVTKSLYTKLINKQQHAKVERTDEKLSELKLAPMTDAEKTTATSKAGESSLTRKKNPLRIATIALCIIFFIGSIASVFVANNLNSDGYFDNSYGNGSGNISKLTFTLNDDGQSYAITGANTSISGDVTIPSRYKGKPVTRIGASAFYYCTGLTSIVIPDSVTTIGSNAFRKCTSLTSVTIGDSVTTIGDMAFYGCDSLTSVTFEDTTTWYITKNYYDWQYKTGGTHTSVTNSSTNARNLKGTYYDYYLYKI